MSKPKKTMELKFERTIATSPEEAFDAWLNPETPGTPWHESEKLLFNPKVDGLWNWIHNGKSHYGKFTDLERGQRIRLTWVSAHTLGFESIVMLTFVKKGDSTLMTLVHSDLPDDEVARGHQDGWNYFLDKLVDYLKS